VIELELAMADLETVQKAAEKATKKARGQDDDAKRDLTAYEKVLPWLEAGKPVRAGTWTEAEAEVLGRLFLLTAKPVLYVANVGQDDLEGKAPAVAEVMKHAADHGSEAIALCADLEGELALMAPEERVEFLQELGLPRSGLERLVRAAYHLLGLMSFYTAGPKEIRAWTIHQGDTAPEAAGVIHTDFEKAFIRAEVYGVDDLTELGSEEAIRSKGRMRTEGRDYVMHDGDVAHFLVGK
jgi:GTP-binding protein YchF